MSNLVDDYNDADDLREYHPKRDRARVLHPNKYGRYVHGFTLNEHNSMRLRKLADGYGVTMMKLLRHIVISHLDRVDGLSPTSTLPNAAVGTDPTP